jgi:hypothetical protein
MMYYIVLGALVGIKRRDVGGRDVMAAMGGTALDV